MLHDRTVIDPLHGRDLDPLPVLRERVASLNARYGEQDAASILAGALSDTDAGSIAMVSSFGAESVALLHLLAGVDAGTPVLFIDTRLLFPETLAYQRDVADKLGLRDVRVIRTDTATLAERDPYGALRYRDPDACCALRKTLPLDAALGEFNGWITGRKRYQTETRARIDVFELEQATGRIKVNPLAHWSSRDVQAYMDTHRLPRHPLVSRGFPSIGCLPCTTRVAEGEHPRAGRWRSTGKDECGIHVVNGRIVRQGAPA